MHAKEIISILVSKIFSDPTFNCRGAITPIDVLDLVQDIEKHGLQQPIVVKPYEHDKYDYRIVSGHRRHKAFEVLDIEYIPCIINEFITEAQALILNLGENLHRKDLNILQEAEALYRLKLSGIGVKDAAEQLGKSTTWIDIRFKLLELPESIRQAAAAGFINQQQIRELARMPEIKDQIEHAKKIKSARLKGEKAPKIRKYRGKRNILKAKERDRDDIFWMQDHIQNAVGNNFGTRCLAWAAGEISDFELFQDIKDIAEYNNKIYIIPYKIS